jgi:hypothetical protein
MASTYYLGRDPVEILGNAPQFFYGMRRNADGELFLVRNDQLRGSDSIEINIPGVAAEDFEDFEAGVDFFEGISANHESEYPNLKYTQYKWDDRSIFYYVNDDGHLVMRVNKGYTYPTGVSSDEFPGT